MSTNDWLEPLLKKVAANFSKDVDDVSYELDSPDDTLFISTIFFVNLVIKSGNDAKSKKVSLVVKRPPALDAIRETMKTDEQFHNEILFYERYAKDHEEFPRCFYAEEKPSSDSVMVLENVAVERGYSMCQHKFNVPLEYTMAAVREIGRFHARAYVMKEQRREEFFELVNDIQEVRYFPGSNMKIVMNGTALRSVDYLRKQDYDEQFCDKLEAQLEDTYNNVILKVTQPEEPLATLCHGDFTINNALFKRENGELKAIVIDFALMRYGSPVLDLSTFLCLHCAEQVDKDMLNSVLRTYHDSLTKCLEEHGVDCEKYSYEALHEDYKKKGLFGFFISTFFLAMVMGRSDRSAEDLAQMDINEWGTTLSQLGGDEISEILANMLLRLREFGCLDHLLND